MKPHRKIVDEWLERVKDDLRSAEIIVKENGPPNTVAFLSQQAVEKVLKAFLVAQGEVPPRIHHLVNLLELCQKHDNSVKACITGCALLDDFYTDSRYPDDLLLVTADEAAAALASAQDVTTFIESALA
jgi:HEPN domain-containing protein